jgi:hypothetical protein
MLAEAMFDGRDFRHGSSLDEVVGFKVFVTNISAKTGTPFENVALRILAGVVADLGQHRPEVEAIAAALMARGELKTNALNKVISSVRVAKRNNRLAGAWKRKGVNNLSPRRRASSIATSKTSQRADGVMEMKWNKKRATPRVMNRGWPGRT